MVVDSCCLLLNVIAAFDVFFSVFSLSFVFSICWLNMRVLVSRCFRLCLYTNKSILRLRFAILFLSHCSCMCVCNNRGNIVILCPFIFPCVCQLCNVCVSACIVCESVGKFP